MTEIAETAGRPRRRLAALAAVLALAAGPALAEGPVPILAYHRFDPAQAGSTTVLASTFEAQLDWLAAHRYRIVPLREAAAELAGTAPAAAGRVAAITVDDGHVSTYRTLFPLILKRRIPVTLFVYPSAISNAPYALTWEQLREMRASGLVDVQSHTYWHPNFKTEKRRRAGADYEAFVDTQMRRSKAVIEARLGASVTLLDWPFGIVDADLEAAARRAGYVAAFAYSGRPAIPGDDPMALPRIPIADADRGARFAAKVQAVPRKAPRP